MPTPTTPILVNGTQQTGTRSPAEWTSLRVLLLSGQAFDEVARACRDDLGTTRQQIVGKPVTSRNPLLRYANQNQVRTPQPGCIGLGDEVREAIGDWSGELDWEAMPSEMVRVLVEADRFTMGANECFIAANWKDERLDLEVVTPDRIIGWGKPGRPQDPEVLGYVRSRDVDGEDVDCTEIYDLREPSFRVYRGIPTTSRGQIIGTEIEVPGVAPAVGAGYTWRWTQDGRGHKAGDPYIPGVLYHRAPSPFFIDPWGNFELVTGTLETMVEWTFARHALIDASWPQRWASNAKPAGNTAQQPVADGRVPPPASIVTDPATLLLLDSIDGDRPIMTGQWVASADVEALYRSCLTKEQSLETIIDPLAYSETGGDPAKLSAEAKKIRLASLYPTFRRYDSDLLAICSAIVNVQTGSTCPESGYKLSYGDEPRKPPEPEITIEPDAAGGAEDDSTMPMEMPDGTDPGRVGKPPQSTGNKPAPDAAP